MPRAKDTNARVTRWFLTLQDFHFAVRHQAGAANANADGLSWIWEAFTGLSGVTPHPPPKFPLLSHDTNGTRTTLGEGGRGECDECPEASSASPWKQARNTCPSSSQADRSQLQLITRQLHKPAPLEHSTDSLHRERRKRAPTAPEHPRGLFPLFALPSFKINPPSGAFIKQSLSCDPSPRDYIYIYNFFLFIYFYFFFICKVYIISSL